MHFQNLEEVKLDSTRYIDFQQSLEDMEDGPLCSMPVSSTFKNNSIVKKNEE